MNMMKRSMLVGLVFGLVSIYIAIGAPKANAAAALQIFDGSTTVTIYDDGAGDLLSTTVGAIYGTGSIGSWSGSPFGYSIVGITNSYTGDPPGMNLSVSGNSTGTADLTVMLSDTNFTTSGPISFDLGCLYHTL